MTRFSEPGQLGENFFASPAPALQPSQLAPQLLASAPHLPAPATPQSSPASSEALDYGTKYGGFSCTLKICNPGPASQTCAIVNVRRPGKGMHDFGSQAGMVRIHLREPEAILGPVRFPGSFLRRLAWWLVATLTAAAGLARAEQVMVAVAANFSAPAKDIKVAFEGVSKHRVVIVPGSTGSLYAQVRNGAPFHVLLAADDTTPRRLEAEGLTVQGTRSTYAIGRLALWSATPGRIDEDAAVLRQKGLGRIAVANPALAPYGAAAIQVMERMELLPQLRPRLVVGESVGQAYQFTASGNAQAGFVALGQVMRGGRIEKGSAWVVPESMHDPIRQDAVLLLAGQHREGARAFLSFLASPAARTIIREHGYSH